MWVKSRKGAIGSTIFYAGHLQDQFILFREAFRCSSRNPWVIFFLPLRIRLFTPPKILHRSDFENRAEAPLVAILCLWPIFNLLRKLVFNHLKWTSMRCLNKNFPFSRDIQKSYMQSGLKITLFGVKSTQLWKQILDIFHRLLRKLISMWSALKKRACFWIILKKKR